MAEAKDDIVLSIRGMSKSFGRNRVLDHINMDVKLGTVMGLMGENAPDRAELIEASRQNALITEFFMEIDKIIDNKLGGANGNG